MEEKLPAGERFREKPTIKMRFIRRKPYSFRDGKIKVSLKPYREYFEFKGVVLVPKDAEMGGLS